MLGIWLDCQHCECHLQQSLIQHNQIWKFQLKRPDCIQGDSSRPQDLNLSIQYLI